MKLVSDASPLIALASIGGLFLLDRFFALTLLPPGVFEEVSIKNKPFARELEQWAKPRQVMLKHPEVANTLGLVLGRGESEAIALYYQEKANFLLIDDAKARSIAKLRNIPTIGTLGLLLKAKENGAINSLRPLLERLVTTEMRIAPDLIEFALKKAGE